MEDLFDDHQIRRLLHQQEAKTGTEAAVVRVKDPGEIQELIPITIGNQVDRVSVEGEDCGETEEMMSLGVRQ